MTDTELLRFTRTFRRGLLGRRSSQAMCAAVCYPLASLLGLSGVAVHVVESDLGYTNHVWLRLADGRALDPTADQFNIPGGPHMPDVYLGPPTIYHIDDRPAPLADLRHAAGTDGHGDGSGEAEGGARW